MGMLYAAIDIHKRVFQAAVLDPASGEIAEARGLDLDAIAMLAMATGWSSEETKRIREYDRQILDGRSFRLQSAVGPKPGDCKY